MISEEKCRKIAYEYYNDVFGFCHARLSEEEACDVTQEVFLFFQKNYKNLSDERIKSYLFNVANKKIHEKYRELKKLGKEISFDDEAFRTEYENSGYYELSDYEAVSDEEIKAAKTKLFEKLTEEEKQLFKMIYIEHLKYSEIAVILNISEKAVGIRALRMRNKIKKLAAEAFTIILGIAFFFIF